MYNSYDLGDLVRVSGPFTIHSTDTAIDPDTVKVTVRSPSDVTTNYVFGIDVELVKDDVGQYHADIDADEAGYWFYRWWSTGTGQAAQEKRFKVRDAHAIAE